MQLTIRAAVPEDLAALLELERLCFDPPWTGDMLLSEINSPDAYAAIAETGGSFCGFAVFHRAGDQAELYQIAVSPDRRRQGIALQLLEAGDRQARAMACTGLYLEVRESNRPAIELYEACGYTGIGKRKKYYVNPTEDALLYCKELVL